MHKSPFFSGALAKLRSAPAPQRSASKPAQVLTWADQICALGNGFVGNLRSIDLKTGAEEQRFFRTTATGELLSILPTGQVADNQIARLSRLPLASTPSFSALPLAAIADAETQEAFAQLAEDLPNLAQKGTAAIAVAEGQFWFLDADVLEPEGTGQGLLHLSLIEDEAQWSLVPVTALALSRMRCITALAAFAPWLYVAVSDPVAGFALYRCDLGDTSGDFEPVLTHGAQRFALNGAISAMALGPSGLILGTAALAHGKHPIGNWGPELLLIDQDGSWDMILGQPRFCADYMRFPRAAAGPGFGNSANAAVKAIAHAETPRGLLTCVVLQAFSGKPVADRAKVHFDPHDYAGDVRLYTSPDLEDWTPHPVTLPPDCGAVNAAALSRAGVLIGHETLGEMPPPTTFIAL